MFSDSLTNNAPAIFFSSFSLKFGITDVLNSLCLSLESVIQSLKTFTAAESKIFKIPSSVTNRDY